MARSQETFGKKEREKKRLKKRKEKLERKEERKENNESNGPDDMIAYVDEYGRITDTPPDPAARIKVKAENIELGVPKRDAESAVRTGRVDFFNEAKGFGFIKEKDTNEKFFVHVHGLLEEVNEGDNVTFELERGIKGMNAVGVRRAK